MNESQEIARLGGVGILIKQDLPSLSKAQRRIVVLMEDEHWHSATEIIEASGQREGLRRLRDLRSKGYTVNMERDGESREFFYQLLPPE
jgi:hypothetical protein